MESDGRRDKKEPSECRLGKNFKCQNPHCPNCFPQLGGSGSPRSGTWAILSDSIVSGVQPVASRTTRSTSVELVELLVVLCSRDGSRRHPLKAIRCFRDSTLEEIRSVVENEIPSLSSHFSFLRIVGGSIVLVTKDQESGKKAYKAKHFVPPHAPTPHLLIYGQDPPSITPKTIPTRQISDDVIEFCVKHMIEGKVEEADANIIGMIRLSKDASLSEIRKELATQLPQIPSEYRFVRMLQGEVTLLTSAQEKSICKRPLHAYHFAPPYTEKAEIIVLTKKCYTEGEIMDQETKTRELKSLASALHNPRTGQANVGKNPRDMVKEKAPSYINAFLNSAGGVLIFGANDDGVIERVPISGVADSKCTSLEERVKLARAVKDDIRKLIDAIAIHMDPIVDDDLVSTLFVPVHSSNQHRQANSSVCTAEEEIYNVIEIHVKRGRKSIYFLDKHSFDAYERREGSTHLIDADAIMDIIGRNDSTWRGGWRQLHSSFDFNPLMRRLSDPWAGREWLFAATRQALFRILDEAPLAKDGIGIVGSRGEGKTAFISELALRPKHVTSMDCVAYHLCRSEDPDTLNPALFVHSLAAMLARRCREYRSLMIDSSGQPGEDSIGATMLRVLRMEHCENDPDDAFLRGVLKPLREIESRRKEDKQRCKVRTGLPLILLVDAIEESLQVEYHRRSGSSTIAHLLERALVRAGGFPSWIKIIVSFREEMAEIPGPIQSLTTRLDLIKLDPDPDSQMELQRAQDDIRLFVEAYIERMGMQTPFGSRIGRGSWDFEAAAAFAKKLKALKSDQHTEWQYEAQPGGWVAFDEPVAIDLDFAYTVRHPQCYLLIKKTQFVVDMQTMTLQNLKSGTIQNVRIVEASSDSDEPEATTKAIANACVTPAETKTEAYAIGNASSSETRSSSGRPCFYCNRLGHDKKDCSLRKEDEIRKLAEEKVLCERENACLDALASKSQGNYLYARSVLDDIISGRLQWEQVPSLPSGLDHLYSSFFRMHFGQSDQGIDMDIDFTDEEMRKPEFRAVKPVLEILLAAPKRGVTEREITSAVVTCGACDPQSVAFCLQDIRWALDIDKSPKLPRYSIRHESIRAWLRDYSNASVFGLQEEHGHAMLAASLLQRCWPQQSALSRWLSALQVSPSEASASAWYRWTDWKPNDEDEDVFNLVIHLVRCGLGDDEERVNLLKSIGSQNIDSTFRRQTTALHSASSVGNVEAVKLLLAAKANPNISVRGRCPLHLAASKGYSESVEALLSAGADVTLTTSSGRSALLNAAGRGSVSTVKCILRSIASFQEHQWRGKGVTPLVDVSQTETGRTPLSIATEEGHDKIIDLLLKANASVFLADRWGRTPLYYAARYGRVEADTVKALLFASRGQETLRWGECRHNRSPLHVAVWYGHIDIVRVLLEMNADPNLVEKDGGSPLHEAAYFGSYGHEREKMRQSHPRHESELHAAMYCESVRLEILQRLLDSDRCIVDLVEVHGCTPLWYAAGGGWTRAVEALLDAGANVNFGKLPRLPHKGRNSPVSPLLYAIERGHYEVAMILLDRGAHIPQFCDVDALCSSSELPDGLVDKIRAAQRERLPSESNFREHGIVSYTMATKCTPVPKDAFAQSPIQDIRNI